MGLKHIQVYSKIADELKVAERELLAQMESSYSTIKEQKLEMLDNDYALWRKSCICESEFRVLFETHYVAYLKSKTTITFLEFQLRQKAELKASAKLYQNSSSLKKHALHDL